MLDFMFGMTVHTTAIVLAIVLAAIGLIYLLLGWLRKRSGRVLMRGLGFVLMPIGLLVMGLMSHIVDGLNAVVDWAKATYMDAWVFAGLVLAGLGLVLYLVGSFVPHVTGDEAGKRRAAIRDRKLAALQASHPVQNPAPASPPAAVKPSAGPTPPPAPAPQPPSTVKPPSAPMTDDDKEIDDILKRHGIN